MLKLPTSLFECVCFICVNIVSFSSLWGLRSPRLFITVFFQPYLKQTKHELTMFLRKLMRSVCPRWCTSIFLLPHYSLFYGLFFPQFYFRIYSTLRFPAEVKYTIWHCFSNPESLNGAFGLPYIKINSLSAHRTRPWSQKRTSFICDSHTFGHVSGPLVSRAYTYDAHFYQTGGYFMQFSSLSRHL